MSIGVIMTTVVTKIEAIREKYPGGLDSYLEFPYIWHDEHIVGSSFMSLRDAIGNVEYFEKLGICTTGPKADCALVTECLGLVNPCDWLDVGFIGEDYACWLKGKKTEEIVLPKEILQQEDEFKNIRIYARFES